MTIPKTTISIFAIVLMLMPCLPVLAQSESLSATDKPEAGKLSEKQETLAEDVKRRLGVLFEDGLPKLKEALKLYDKHESLPDKTYIFGDDKISNQSEIDDLLDEAVRAFGVSRIKDLRDTIRQLQKQIRDAYQRVADYRQKRITAPVEKEEGLLNKVNPFATTREDYDKMISADLKNIKAWEKEIEIKKREFIEALRDIGLQVSDQAADTLLFSVSGDDMVAMSVVFDNIKLMTQQLQQLTDENKEALDQAKRYYGMYVVMVRIMDRMQKQFLSDIENKYTPQLQEYIKQADKNIAQARKLLDEGGDRNILLSNIESNAVTRKAAELYIEYLKEQKEMISYENKQVEKTLAAAVNTYRTVKLSSDVASLIKTGRRNFDALMKIRMPYLREFQNDVIRRELKLMTEKLKR